MQSDFAGIVNSGAMKGPVNILTGVHGSSTGAMTADLSLVADDVAAFGTIPGVTVHDVSQMSASQIGSVLNSAGTTIGAFCNSGICLAPFR